MTMTKKQRLELIQSYRFHERMANELMDKIREEGIFCWYCGGDGPLTHGMIGVICRSCYHEDKDWVHDESV